MPKFGNTSQTRLDTCHPDLVKIMEHAIARYDFSIAYGVRTDEEQHRLFMKGREEQDGSIVITDKSKVVTYVDGTVKKSRHQEVNGFSMAVDIVPYVKGRMEWNDDKEWKKLSREVWKSIQSLQFSGQLTHIVRWGGFWTTLNDRPHWEIVNGH